MFKHTIRPAALSELITGTFYYNYVYTVLTLRTGNMLGMRNTHTELQFI